MNRLRRVFFLCVLFLFFVLGFAQAQRTLGVVWNIPNNEQQAVQELQQFQSAGISVLILQQLPTDDIWGEIKKRELKVVGSLGIQFPTAHTFANKDSLFKSDIHDKATAFLNHPSVNALELFRYGAIHHSHFGKATTDFFESFKTLSPTRLFIMDSRIVPKSNLPTGSLIYDIRVSPANIDSLTVPQHNVIGAYKYSPTPKIHPFLKPLKIILDQSSSSPQKTVFLDGHWLLSMFKKHTNLQSNLHSLSTGEQGVFPLPRESMPSQKQSSLPIIILLIVWGLSAYHYNVSPLYRKSLFRYYTGHRFFLDDVRHRHIRSTFPGLIIMLQNALIMVATFFVVLKNSWSTLGLESLNHHFPALFFLTGSWFDIAILSFGAILFIYCISVLWMAIAHKSIQSISQIMTLYAWPMQLNFLIGTLAIAIHTSGGSIHITAVLAGLMIVVLLASFVAAAFDTARFLYDKRFQYLGLTVGLYALTFVAAAVWLFAFNDQWWQAINLSLRLT